MSLFEITSQYRNRVIKKTQHNDGEAIRTDYFIDPRYACISAILFSYANIMDSIDDSALGRDFFMIHNPLAVNPLPFGSFNCGIEYLVEDNSAGIKITTIEHENKS